MEPYVQYITEGSGTKTQSVITKIRGIYFEDGYFYVTYEDANGKQQRKGLPFKEGHRLAVFPNWSEQYLREVTPEQLEQERQKYLFDEGFKLKSEEELEKELEEVKEKLRKEETREFVKEILKKQKEQMLDACKNSPHVPESPKLVSELYSYPEATIDVFDRQGRRIWGGYVDRCRFQGDHFVAEKYYKDANKFRTVVAVPKELFGHYYADIV